jgi:hypothetical protein
MLWSLKSTVASINLKMVHQIRSSRWWRCSMEFCQDWARRAWFVDLSTGTIAMMTQGGGVTPCGASRRQVWGGLSETAARLKFLFLMAMATGGGERGWDNVGERKRWGVVVKKGEGSELRPVGSQPTGKVPIVGLPHGGRPWSVWSRRALAYHSFQSWAHLIYHSFSKLT